MNIYTLIHMPAGHGPGAASAGAERRAGGISLSRGSVLSREYFPSSLHWKKSSVYDVLGSKIHTRLAIVTANELGLAFPPRNLPKKFRPDPSTFYLVIVVTDKQDKQTNVRR